jgi:hypothetical protein
VLATIPAVLMPRLLPAPPSFSPPWFFSAPRVLFASRPFFASRPVVASPLLLAPRLIFSSPLLLPSRLIISARTARTYFLRNFRLDDILLDYTRSDFRNRTFIDCFNRRWRSRQPELVRQTVPTRRATFRRR